MNFHEIEVGKEYMVYEDNVGKVKVLAKHVIGYRELIWYQKGNDHGFGQPKYFSPPPMSRGEVISQLTSDLIAFTAKPHTDGTLYDFLSYQLEILINNIDDGKVQWYTTI